MSKQLLDIHAPIQVPVRITLDNGASYDGEARFIAEWFHIKTYWFRGFDEVFNDDKVKIKQEQLVALMNGTGVRVRMENLLIDFDRNDDGCNAWVHPLPSAT